MADPQFSVIIPTFNRERTIERALESVLAQRQPAGEIILVDDGSSDGTTALVRRRFPDVRLLQFESNRGPAIARNMAIEHAVHDHLAFLDSDDAWDPDYLAA
ncbi:MAG: glycosyltransferase family 2 protein, partial [Geminicoccaceae bacterium]